MRDNENKSERSADSAAGLMIGPQIRVWRDRPTRSCRVLSSQQKDGGEPAVNPYATWAGFRCEGALSAF